MNFFLEHIWLIPLFPAAGALIMLLFGKRLPNKAVAIICPGMVLTSFIFAVSAVHELSMLPVRQYEKILYSWIPGASYQMSNGYLSQLGADWGFLLDPLSSVMVLIVTGVGFLIHVYAAGYMSHEGGFYRFFGYLNLFMFSMLTLVLANNYLLLFVGWEGVGVCSYLLIGFYFHKKSAGDAGKKAFIANRVGDAGVVLGMFTMLATFGSIRYTTVMPQAGSGNWEVGDPAITLITLLLFIGVTGKSAQIPLYVWLPDAMEGPTPVSALIHAATMVTAGVYLMARSNVLYALSPTSMLVVAVVGALTAIFAASIGVVQNDIKRVLAYSTVSQLGYMVLACGVGAFGAGVFHLMTHAFFKALLFLGAGSVIHALSGEQDMRKMGALRARIPYTYWTFFFAWLAIIGTPGLAGFFSKDEILWRSFISPVGSGPLLYTVALITAGLTAFYMSRLVFLTFFGDSRVEKHAAEHLHESPPVMTIPLMVLAVLSIFGGYLGVPAILGGSNFLEHWLEPVMGRGAEIIAEHAGHGEHSHSTEYMLMALSVGVAGLGVYLAYYFFLKNPAAADRIAENFRGLHKTLENKYYVDEVYNALIVRGTVMNGGEALSKFDARVVDGGVNGAAWLTRLISTASIWWDRWVVDGAVRLTAFTVQLASLPVRILQTGSVQLYAFSILTGLLIFFSYYMFK